MYPRLRLPLPDWAKNGQCWPTLSRDEGPEIGWEIGYTYPRFLPKKRAARMLDPQYRPINNFGKPLALRKASPAKGLKQ